MMRFAEKLEVGSLMLILLNISLYLVSNANIVAAAPPPFSSVLSATTSSSTSASGLPLPPSKMPAANVQDTSEAKNSATVQVESRTNLPYELQNQALPSLAKQTSGSIEATDNQIAHHEGEIAPLTTLGGEIISAIGGGMSNAINGEKGASFVDFPPFSKQISPETRYQRQRRSYPISSLSQLDAPSAGPRPDEVELRLDDERDQEALLKLMSIILANSRNGDANTNDNLSPYFNPDNEDGQDDDANVNLGNDDSIDLGTFDRPVASPYWTPAVGRPNEPISVMASILAAETPRLQGHRAHYGLREGQASVPLDTGIVRRAFSLRDEDDNDGEWMDEAVPLHGSHYKTRRSGPAGNTEFTFNPVKSHFRRYLRAFPLKSGRGLETMANGAHFGSVLPSRYNRRRRAAAGTSTKNAFPTVHWM